MGGRTRTRTFVPCTCPSWTLLSARIATCGLCTGDTCHWHQSRCFLRSSPLPRWGNEAQGTDCAPRTAPMRLRAPSTALPSWPAYALRQLFPIVFFSRTGRLSKRFFAGSGVCCAFLTRTKTERDVHKFCKRRARRESKSPLRRGQGWGVARLCLQ